MGSIEKYYSQKSGLTYSERGFTPFQFSSRQMQVNTTQLGGLIPDNPISDLMNESMSWYEMWINPERIAISRQMIQKKTHTAGSVVTYHFRPELETMRVSGVCGWIAINPQSEEKPRSLGFKSPPSAKEFYKIWGSTADTAKNNSPRVFLKRLRDMAESPMYFVDLKGVEHYNTKYIKIFTKQYPYGIVCEGYYVKFDVPESGDDVQTINYEFEFVIERKVSISSLQRMAGMWGNAKSRSALGRSIRSLPGLGT